MKPLISAIAAFGTIGFVGSGASASAQEPELLAQGIEMPSTEGTDIAIDDQHVYFSSVAPSGPAEGYLGRVPLDGGAIETVASGIGVFDFGTNRPANKIILTSNAIIVGYGGYDTYAIERLDYDGANREVLARPTGGYLLSSIGSDVFFGRAFNSIWRVNMNAPSDTNQVTTGRYWVRNNSQDQNNTYFNEYFTRSLFRIDPSSETVPETILARAGNAPEGVVRNNQDYVFFGPRGSLSIIPKSGGSTTTVQLSDPSALLRAVDEQFAYYTVGTNELWQMSIADQTQTNIVSGADFSGLGAFEESEGYLYYTQRDPNDVTSLNLYRLNISGVTSDPFEVAPPLQAGFLVTQDYACYECNTETKTYHTGLDLDEVSENPIVSASQQGEIFALFVTDTDSDPNASDIEQNAWCEQSDSDLVSTRERWGELGSVEKNNAGFGNTIILRHPNPDEPGEYMYTQYSHLKCIEREIAFAYLDQRGSQGPIAPVSLGQRLGILGGSGRTRLDVYGTHLHFEVKKFGTLGQSSFGYSERPPSFADYLDPFVYLHRDNVVQGPYTKLVGSETAEAEILPGPGYSYVDGFYTNRAWLASGTQAVIRKLILRPDAETGEDGLWAQIDVAIKKKACRGADCGGMNEPEGWVKIGNVDGTVDASFPIQVTGPSTTILAEECEAIKAGGDFRKSPIFQSRQLQNGDRVKAFVLPCQSFDLLKFKDIRNPENKRCNRWEKIGLGRAIPKKANGSQPNRTFKKGFICADRNWRDSEN